VARVVNDDTLAADLHGRIRALAAQSTRARRPKGRDQSPLSP